MAVRGHGVGEGAFWGDFVGKNPTDRGKPGTKRGVLTDGDGGPLGVMIAPANTPDCKLIEGIVESVVVDRPPPEDGDQHLCLDKGFDTKDAEAVVVKAGYEPHIRRIGEEATACDRAAGHKPRRWVVERSHSWFNRFRALLIRWEKKAENYLSELHLACAFITFRVAGLLR